jgi:hypothetical protein
MVERALSAGAGLGRSGSWALPSVSD